MFKALFIGYLFGICSERQLMREIEVNVAYRCPEGQALIYATKDRQGYRHYKRDPVKCRNCPLLVSCTTNPKAPKSITRHVWADARERTDAHCLTDWGKHLYERRKETVERSFADAKQVFGHRYARHRGSTGVKWQCLLAATVQNIKKIATPMDAKGKTSSAYGAGIRLFSNP